MKLNSNYSSDISSLLDIKRNDSIFISTWNKDEEINPFPNAKIIEYNQLNSSQVSDYYFSDEFLDLKKYIISENDEFKRNNIFWKFRIYLTVEIIPGIIVNLYNSGKCCCLK